MYNACRLLGGVEVQMKNAEACKSRAEQSGIVLPMVLSSGELALVPAPDPFATSSPCLYPPFGSLLAIVYPIIELTAFTSCARYGQITHFSLFR